MSSKKFKVLLKQPIQVGKCNSELPSTKGTVVKQETAEGKKLKCFFKTKKEANLGFTGVKMNDQKAKYLVLKRKKDSGVVEAFNVENWFTFNKDITYQTYSSEQVEEYLKLKEKLVTEDFEKAISTRKKPLSMEVEEDTEKVKSVLGKKRKKEEEVEEDKDLDSLFNDSVQNEKQGEDAESSSEGSSLQEESSDLDRSLGDIEGEEDLFGQDYPKKKLKKNKQKEIDEKVFNKLCLEGMKTLFKTTYLGIREYLREKNVEDSVVLAKLGAFLEKNCRKLTEKKETVYLLK